MKKYIEFLLNAMICVLLVECIGSIVYVFSEYDFVVSTFIENGPITEVVSHFLYNSSIAFLSWRYLVRRHSQR